jgi:hypothetical protein
MSRTTLATIPGNDAGTRILVSLVQSRDGKLAIDLRQQHHADGIGWFDQRSLVLEPRQLQQLQSVLNLRATEIEAAAAETPNTLPFPIADSSPPSRNVVGS